MAHPSYRNPTLQEALCEFQLASAWSPGKPAPLIERLREGYPDFETITQQGVAVAIGPDGALIPSPVQPRLRLKFSKSGGAPFILQFQTGVFSIHVLRPYPGWSAFRTELLRVWPVVVEVMQPTAVRRIGMRYINRIQRQSRVENPGVWLKRNKFVPDALLESAPDFMARLEMSTDSSNKTFTTVSIDRTVAMEPHGALILDIDRVATEEMQCESNAVSGAIERLHEDVWAVFADLKSEKLEKLLKGELHESAA